MLSQEQINKVLAQYANTEPRDDAAEAAYSNAIPHLIESKNRIRVWLEDSLYGHLFCHLKITFAL